MMKHALTGSATFLLMAGLSFAVPAHAAVALAASPTGARAADMAARLQPAEQQAVLQARPVPATDGGENAPGLLAWPGVPRLGLPVLRMPTFATPAQPGDGPPRPMLPWLALAATWDPDLARRAGVARARAEWLHGRAVLRVGGVDTLPSGRLQGGEDQVLAGSMAGMIGAGLLSGHVLPVFGSVVREEQVRADGAAPERGAPVKAADLAAHSLLGVAMALEVAHGGAMLCGGMAPCAAVTGLEAMVREAWHFSGMIMAVPGGAVPAGAVHGTDGAPALDAVATGVDMEQVGPGRPDVLGEMLREAVRDGHIKPAQVQAMVTHILASFYMAGSLDHPPPFAAARTGVQPPPVDTLVGDVEAEGAVLLQNENRVLPLDPALGPVLVLVHPAMRGAADLLADGLRHAGLNVTVAIAPDGAGATGTLPAACAQAARTLVLSASNDDNQMITTLAELGGHVAVVLTADDPDRQMPWLDAVDSVVQGWAWRDEYAQALSALLSGQQDFSGHLPVTLTGGLYPPGMVDANYRAFERAHVVPLFPFGYGLSARGRLVLSELHVAREGNHLNASFTLSNPGTAAVRAVPQLYVETPPDLPGNPRRLAAWRSVMVTPGHPVRLSVPVSLRLVGQWNNMAGNWAVAAGDYTLSLGFSSVMLVRHATLHLPALHVPATLENQPAPIVIAE
ncbi:glycoside hydrolase family 3 protein [Komagataeibacter xylinus]|uniref:glycoside hydrolase family 3 protein n=1 Tax=Komagataeibacter xylinus TaxID=28448 RepID=UPI001F5DC620|nr:glycoside hydrolase family 3 protein [Komagataeibacter xylinus]